MNNRAERILKWFITAFGRTSFICDSHPWLCINCRKLRNLLKRVRIPNLIIVKTKRGPFVWSSNPRIRVVMWKVRAIG